jgi:hypothetical protein
MKISIEHLKNIYHHAKEMLIPNIGELGAGGLLSISYASLMTEAVHAFFVVLSAVIGGVLLHLARYYMQKRLPLKKDHHE